MPYIPHTEEDTKAMLNALGIESIEKLFDEIPSTLMNPDLSPLPQEGISELAVTQLMKRKAVENRCDLSSFLGAGAYHHYIPAAVWQITSRGEFMTAYTPYQAEASQGTLQTIYEYQSMMANLMEMDISNASMYDGATALAEAVLMAIRLKRHQKKRVLIPITLHPLYRKVVRSIVRYQEIKLQEIAGHEGVIDFNELKDCDVSDVAALIVPQPNFFGCFEEVDQLTEWAHQNDVLLIAVVNPLAISILKPPGKWGGEDKGADIACGEAQPLGIPIAAGGPYMGFMCCKEPHLRQLPGRIVGQTIDPEGQIGYTLTLQAREQHIRRAKATSNICTNQGLMVTAITIYLSLLGAKGLQQTAKACHHKKNFLMQLLKKIPGVEIVYDRPGFHEFVVQLPHSIDQVLKLLSEKYHIEGGYHLGTEYPHLKDTLLICVTEIKTEEELQNYAAALKEILMSVKKA